MRNMAEMVHTYMYARPHAQLIVDMQIFKMPILYQFFFYDFFHGSLHLLYAFCYAYLF